MADHSHFLSQGEVESSVQSTDQQQGDSHELPSLDHQSALYSSLTLDEFQHSVSDGIRSFGSMNMDELLNNIWMTEEIQGHAQTPAPNSSIAISTVATMAAATVNTAAATTNINPQFPEGQISVLTVNNTAIQQSLLKQGSLTLPAPLCQKTMEEVWSEIHKFEQEQEPDSTANVLKAGSAQRQTTSGEITLEDFLVKEGVVRGQGHSPSPVQKHPCESYQNNNKTALGSGQSGYVARPVLALGRGGNVPPYPAVPQSSVGDAALIAVGRSPSGYQPREIHYGGRMQNNASGGGYGQVQGQGSPVSQVSSDAVGANQVDGVNQFEMDIDGAQRWYGPVEKVMARRQRRLMRNRESAARSRARKQARILELEAERNELKKENARLRRTLEEQKRKRKQYIDEITETETEKDRKKGMRRSWSWPY